MASLKLFCDRISHPSRAALLLLRNTGIAHEEVKVTLFKGEHWKRPELPFKKLPVMLDNSSGVTIAESTSILRYIGQMEGGQAWYADRALKEKVKVDEFLDNWQSTINPTALRLVQNKLMYKVM